MIADRLEPAGGHGGLARRLPAAIKLVATLALLIWIASTPFGKTRPLALPAIILVAAALASRVPPVRLLMRILALEPFVAGIALLSLLQPRGGMVFLSLLARSTLCLFAVVLLSSTTSFADLLRLFRRLRAPSLLVTVLALMHRYLFLLIEEMARLRAARASRTFTRRRARAWVNLAAVAAQLFVRSSERGERIYAAMRARGWK